MGSSCSSAQRKAKKSGLPSDEQRRESVLSTDSIPYGKASPPAPRKTSNGRSNPPVPQPEPPPPVPAQGNHEPLRKISASPETPGLPDLQQFPEKVASLLMGRYHQVLLAPSVREINIYICADFKETSEERDQLRQKVMPELRQHCSEKGYILNWLDMHWGVELTEFRDICLDTILKEKSGRLLMLLLIDEMTGLGAILPPQTVEESDFQKALEGASTSNEQKTLLQDGYRSNDDTTGRILRSGCSSEQRQNLVSCLRSAWTEQELRSKYLISVLEDVLRQSVLKDSRLAKRSLWLQPRLARSPRQPGMDEDSVTRFAQLKTRLQEQLPDSQKVAWGQGSTDPLQDLCRLATGELKRMIDILIEEDFVDEARKPYKGIETPLCNDLLLHTEQARHYCCSFVGRDDVLTTIRSYLTGPTNSPLVLHSPPGHGKSALIARAAQLAAEWMPNTPVVLRFVGTTPDSMTPEQLLRSICEQLCALYGDHPAVAFKRLRDQEEPLGSLLEKVSAERPLLVMIDGLEQIAPYARHDLSWLTPELPNHVKVILTVQDDTPDMKTLQELLPGKEAYLAVPQLTAEEASGIIDNLLKGSTLVSDKLKTILDSQTTPLHTTLLARTYLDEQDQSGQAKPGSTTDDLVKSRISALEATVGVVKIVFGLLASARYGLSDCEMLEILNRTGSVAKPHLVWTLFKRHLDDFLRTLVVGGTRLVTYRNATMRTLCCGQDVALEDSRKALRDFFRSEGHLWPNRRKMDELTYCQHHLNDPPLRDSLLEPDWLMQKVTACDPYTLLEELDMVNCDQDLQLRLLYEVIQRAGYALRYDGSQLLTQLYIQLTPLMTSDNRAEELPALRRLLELSRRPPVSSLLPVSMVETLIVEADEGKSNALFTALYTIRDRRNHLLSLTPPGGEIVVWDVFRQEAVRTLTGVVEPKDVRMIDDRRALVLCGRELKVYDLEEGRLLSKLKGVMNQQMAYFGLHDENYVVALSRNRMYVNMMSVKTGDLETTFKVGEDRFLNSLLVSSNGRICVCGDETQKPFPLLVWDLANRKLLYDLRIPHHEFLTRMSAISHDGHYVVCVCREIDDGAPNFIIVYDLQSGTLFKKWKPESDSCSIAISSHGGCVINGLENTLVLVWDLSTGARRHNLQGHTAPVDQIKLDDQGVNCLTYDSSGRDRSIRVWDVAKGECLAVYTPHTPVRCAQLTLDGLAVVAGLEGQPGISTLLLCQNKTLEEMIQPNTSFGEQGNEGGVFDVSQQG